MKNTINILSLNIVEFLLKTMIYVSYQNKVMKYILSG